MLAHCHGLAPLKLPPRCAAPNATAPARDRHGERREAELGGNRDLADPRREPALEQQELHPGPAKPALSGGQPGKLPHSGWVSEMIAGIAATRTPIPARR